MRSSKFFCILNPDVRLLQDPFLPFFNLLSDRQIGIAAPLIIRDDHSIEDSARRLPTPLRLLKRVFFRNKADKLDYDMSRVVFPDWVAGIFMFFSSSIYSEMNGFDERYYLYLEDVDLCSRLRLAGYRIILDPSISVIHEARRDSHRRLQYLWWHTRSGIRFFSSRIFWAALLKEIRN